MRRWILAAALSSCTFAAGCRTPATASDVKTTFEAIGGDALLVVVGGWMSCKQALSPSPVDMFLYDQAENLAANLKAGLPQVRVHKLYVCLRLKPPVSGAPMWYMRSDRGNVVYSNDVTELHNTIRAMAQQIGTPAIFLMGHSYGGYVAMDTASKMSDMKLAGLYTIDPISAETCKVMDNLPIAAGNPDCQRPPTTLPNTVIRASTLGWINFHQPLGSLHASPIAEAANLQIDLPYGDKAHHRLGFDPLVWNPICRSITNTLGVEATEHCKDITVDENGNRTGGGNVPTLATGVYKATAPGRCAADAKVTNNQIMIKFTQCQTPYVATHAQLACDLAGACRGNLLKPGPLGNLRKLSPLQNDYFLKITADGYDLHPQGFGSPQKVTYQRQ